MRIYEGFFARLHWSPRCTNIGVMSIAALDRLNPPDFGSAGHSEAPLFSDGLGDRVVSADPTTGDLVQILRINPALTAVPSFEFALRERVARLANFRHGYYARVRRVDRAQPPRRPWRSSPTTSKARGSPRSCASPRSAAAARHQCRAVPDPPAGAGGGAAARKRPRCRARPGRARAAGRHAARPPGHRRARLRRRGRADAVRPRAALARVPCRDAAERRHSSLRPARRRHRHRRRRALARARPSVCATTSSRASWAICSRRRASARRSATSSRCRRRCARGSRARCRSTSGARLRPRRKRSRRSTRSPADGLHLRGRAGGARNVSVPLHLGAFWRRRRCRQSSRRPSLFRSIAIARRPAAVQPESARSPRSAPATT